MLQGHDTDMDEPGHAWIKCQRCGANWTNIASYPWIAKRKVAETFLWLANFVDNPLRRQFPKSMTHKPYYRRVDGPLKGYGTKWTVGAYSHEHLLSMMEQEGKDYTLGQLLDESGWMEINDDNAGEMIDLINKSFEYESNRQERKKTMKQAGLEDTPDA